MCWHIFNLSTAYAQNVKFYIRQDLDGLMCLISCEMTVPKLKSVQGLQFLLDKGKGWGGKVMLLKSNLEQTLLSILLQFGIAGVERKGKKYHFIFTRFYRKLKQKQVALVLAHCPPCWCVGSTVSISLQVAEWEQNPGTAWLNLAADWIALTKTFASACFLHPLSSGCRMPNHGRQPSSKFN